MAPFWRILLSACGVLLLAAILFPALRPVRENQFNPQHGCMSNMKQLGLALIQYSQDYNETLPPAAQRTGWREAVYPYVKSASVYCCPEDEHDRSKDAPNHLPKSYAANSAFSGRSLAFVNSNTISAADTRGFDGEDWDMTAPAFLPSAGRELYTHKPSHYFYEHPSGLMNCLFSDGHVKAMKPVDTLTPTNLWTPNNAAFMGPNLTNAKAILTHAENE